MSSADARRASTDGIYFAVPRRILEEDDWNPADRIPETPDRNSPEIPDRTPVPVPSFRSDHPQLMDHFGPDVDEYLLKCSLDKFENQTVATFRKDVITQLSAALRTAETYKKTGSSSDEDSTTSEEGEGDRFAQKSHPIYKNFSYSKQGRGFTSQGFFQNAYNREDTTRRSIMIKKSALPSGEVQRSNSDLPREGAELISENMMCENPVLLSSDSIMPQDGAQLTAEHLIQKKHEFSESVTKHSDEVGTNIPTSGLTPSTSPSKSEIAGRLQEFEAKIRQNAPVEISRQNRGGSANVAVRSSDFSKQEWSMASEVESDSSAHNFRTYDGGEKTPTNISSAEFPEERSPSFNRESADTQSPFKAFDGEMIDDRDVINQDNDLNSPPVEFCVESNDYSSRIGNNQSHIGETAFSHADCTIITEESKSHEKKEAPLCDEIIVKKGEVSSKQSLFLCSMIDEKRSKRSEVKELDETLIDQLNLTGKVEVGTITYERTCEENKNARETHVSAIIAQKLPENTSDGESTPHHNEKPMFIFHTGTLEEGDEHDQLDASRSGLDQRADAPITTQQVAFTLQTQTDAPSDQTLTESCETRSELSDAVCLDDPPEAPASMIPKSLPRTHVHENFKFFRDRGPKFRISDVIPECPEEEARTMPIPKPRNLHHECANTDVMIIVSDEDSHETVTTVVNIKPLARRRGEVPLTSPSSEPWNNDTPSSAPASSMAGLWTDDKIFASSVATASKTDPWSDEATFKSSPISLRMSSSVPTISAFADMTSSWRTPSEPRQLIDEFSSSESTLLALKSMTSSLKAESETDLSTYGITLPGTEAYMTSSSIEPAPVMSSSIQPESKMLTSRMTLSPCVTSPSSAMLAARLEPAVTLPDPLDWARFLSQDLAPDLSPSPGPDSSSLWLSCSEDERQANLLNYDLFRTDFSDADPDLNSEWPFAAAAVARRPLSVFHSECYALHL